MISMALKTSDSESLWAEVRDLGRKTQLGSVATAPAFIEVVDLTASEFPSPLRGSHSEVLGLCVLLAASASRSEHPLSRGCEEGAAKLAGCAGAPKRLLEAATVSDFQVLQGIGVKFALGKLDVMVGNLDYLNSSPELTAWAEEKRSQACTIVAVQVNGSSDQQLVHVGSFFDVFSMFQSNRLMALLLRCRSLHDSLARYLATELSACDPPIAGSRWDVSKLRVYGYLRVLNDQVKRRP